MNIFHRKKEELNTVHWSGGTTTELAVWPEGSTYQGRDFDFRVSTSTVEQEHSVFSDLPGIRRIIMVLEGEMDLEHEGHHNIHLEKSGTDHFEGGWKTISHGRCRDFNLMLRNGMSGEIKYMTIDSGSEFEVTDQDFTGVMLVKGGISYEGKEISEGDFILFILDNRDEKVTFSILKQSEFVVVKIKNQQR